MKKGDMSLGVLVGWIIAIFFGILIGAIAFIQISGKGDSILNLLTGLGA